MRTNFNVSVLDIAPVVDQFLPPTDRQDAEINAKIVGGTCRKGLILKPGDSCTLDETFSSVDSRNPDPEMDVGKWAVRSNVGFERVGSVPPDTEALAPSYEVDVFDPGAQGAPHAAAPAPYSLTLLCVGILTLVVYGWRARQPAPA
jgi:hypothetical protein